MPRVSLAFILSLSIIAAFVFPAITFADPADPWYNTSWPYRVEITIQNAQVDADLTDFPAFVDLSTLPAGFHSNVTSSGGDIRVTTTDGTTEVPREVVVYNAGTDTGELHTKLNVANLTDTSFYIYYGNSGASDYATNATYGAENVWNSNYEAVYHLNEAANTTSGGYLDSTANSKDGTGSSMSASAGTGKLGGKAAQFDGTDDYVGLPTGFGLASPTSQKTIQAWVNVTANDGQVLSFRTADTSGNGIYTLGYGYNGAGNAGTGRPTLIVRDDGQAGLMNRVTGSTINGVGWTMLHVTRNASKQNTIAVNGASAVSGTDAMVNALTPTLNAIGADRKWVVDAFATVAQRYAEGYIDEVRINTVALSAAWIDAEYADQNTPTTFYSVGSVENAPSSSEPAIPIRIIGALLRIAGGSIIFK